MSITLKSLLAIGLLTFVAACAQQEEVAVVDTPVTSDAPMSKY